MAVIMCPDCRGIASTSANSCPKCGRPLTEADKVKKKGFSLKKVILAILGVFVAIVLVMFVVALNTSPEERQANLEKMAAAEAEKARSLPRISSSQLSQEFNENEVAANGAYKGKEIIVTGVIESISTSFSGAPQINLQGMGMFQQVMVVLRKNQADYAARVSKGDRIMLRGKVGGVTIGNVTMDNAVFFSDN